MKLEVLIVIAFSISVKDAAPQIPASARRTLFMEPRKEVPGPEKNYTGVRMKNDSKLMIYHHEQTVAVIEVGRNRELFNCELLEVKTKTDKKAALKFLKPLIPSHIRIAFSDMKNLMEQCQKLDPPKNLINKFISKENRQPNNQSNGRAISSLLNGVFPGTKWCGTGDVAASYFDLGPERQLDKCCRTHDLCPVKVAGLKTQYNITNYSLYTKSHCECDDSFYSCLKNVKSTLSDLMGNIYFNVAQITCVEDVPPDDDNKNKTIKRRFATKTKTY